MKQIGIRELKAHVSQVVQQVAENRASYVITRRGKALGVLMPSDLAPTEATPSGEAAWDHLFACAETIAGRARPKQSGVRELSRMRR